MTGEKRTPKDMRMQAIIFRSREKKDEVILEVARAIHELK